MNLEEEMEHAIRAGHFMQENIRTMAKLEAYEALAALVPAKFSELLAQATILARRDEWLVEFDREVW